MPTQEERLSTLEQTVTVLSKGIRDIHYNETILLGLVSEQGKDIREMKVSISALNERLDVFEQSVTIRFDTLEGRFDTLEGRFGSLEQGMNSRFEEQDKRFEEQDKKLDQVLLLLNTLIPKLE
jgi:chromosome segregation ATPase